MGQNDSGVIAILFLFVSCRVEGGGFLTIPGNRGNRVETPFPLQFRLVIDRWQ